MLYFILVYFENLTLLNLLRKLFEKSIVSSNQDITVFGKECCVFFFIKR